MKALLPILYRWHQTLGVYIALAIICWGLSGLAHPIISRLNPKPVAFSPPAEPLTLSANFKLSTLLQAHDIHSVEKLRIFSWQERPVARIQTPEKLYYLDINNGNKIENAESRYAEYLARYYTGDNASAVSDLQAQNSFNHDYNYINRLLPVQQVSFERSDGLRAYVDTDSGRLGSLADDQKYLTAVFFRNLHSLSFIESNGLRTSIMLLLLTLGFLVSAMGLYLYIGLWRRGAFKAAHKQHKTKRLHRSVGAFVAVAAMGFCFSGALHTWTKYSQTLDPQMQSRQSQLGMNHSSQNLPLSGIALQNALNTQAITDIQLIEIDQKPAWRLKKRPERRTRHSHHGNHAPQQPSDPAIYLDNTLNIIANGSNLHALALASALSRLPKAQAATTAELITQFGGEYGFVNKRLPVYKVDYAIAGEPSVYIESSTQTVAAIVNNSARLEGLSFAYIHKWHHLDFLGKNTRDAILALLALGIVTTLLLGLWRYYRLRVKKV